MRWIPILAVAWTAALAGPAAAPGRSSETDAEPPAACPFCRLAEEDIVAVDGPCVAVRDAHPASPGHTLIVPRRHVSSFRDLSAEEAAAVDRLARRLAAELQTADPAITGFNYGTNDGADAGQTVPHCHFHLIPRRHGDIPDPRGGIRKAISAR